MTNESYDPRPRGRGRSSFASTMAMGMFGRWPETIARRNGAPEFPGRSLSPTLSPMTPEGGGADMTKRDLGDRDIYSKLTTPGVLSAGS